MLQAIFRKASSQQELSVQEQNLAHVA
jgi:hypothetical protein